MVRVGFRNWWHPLKSTGSTRGDSASQQWQAINVEMAQEKAHALVSRMLEEGIDLFGHVAQLLLPTERGGGIFPVTSFYPKVTKQKFQLWHS